MPSSFRFELVSPARLLFAGDVEQVLIPGAEGDMTIMAQHAPVMTALRPGYVEASGQQKVFVLGGFAEVNGSGLTVLAEKAVPAGELTGDMLDHEIAVAEKIIHGQASAEAKRLAGEAVHAIRDIRKSLAH